MKRLFTLFSICLLFILPLVLTSCAENPVAGEKEPPLSGYSLSGAVRNNTTRSVIKDGIVRVIPLSAPAGTKTQTCDLASRYGNYGVNVPEGIYIVVAESNGMESQPVKVDLTGKMMDVDLYISYPVGTVAPDVTYNVEGVVVDEVGSFIPGMTLKVSGGPVDYSVTTALTDGSFLIKGLIPSVYDLTLHDTSKGFGPTSYKLEITVDGEALLEGTNGKRPATVKGGITHFDLGTNLVVDKVILEAGHIEGVVIDDFSSDPVPEGTVVHFVYRPSKNTLPDTLVVGKTNSKGEITAQDLPPGHILLAKPNWKTLGKPLLDPETNDVKDYEFAVGTTYTAWYQIESGKTTHLASSNPAP